MTYGLIDFVGNIGVALMMIAYLLLQLDKLSNGLVYSEQFRSVCKTRRRSYGRLRMR